MLGKLNDTRNKRVLGCTVDERFAFEDGSNRVEGDTSECEEWIEPKLSVVLFTLGMMTV